MRLILSKTISVSVQVSENGLGNVLIQICHNILLTFPRSLKKKRKRKSQTDTHIWTGTFVKPCL